MINKICEELYKLSKKAYFKGEIPIAAIIVKDNKIIAKAINDRENSSNPLYHAEIKAVLKVCKKIKDWRLDDCDMYVTLKPCHMCREVLNEVRIKNVYYFLDNLKDINFKTNFLKIDSIYSENFQELLTNFFKKLR